MSHSDGLEQIGAVPAAESLGAPAHVSDEEFDAWVKRSRDQTDAVLEGWDSSVEFEQERYGDAGVTMEVDGDEVIDAEILNEDGTVATAEEVNRGIISWQNVRERIQRGEEVGPEIREQIAGQTLGPCADPACMVCHPPGGGGGAGGGMWPPWAFVNAIQAGPSSRVIFSLPPQRGRSALVGSALVDAVNAALMRPEFTGPVQLWDDIRSDRIRSDWARRNLESMGFVVMDGRARADTVTLPRAALVKETNRFGYFVSELEVMKATVNRPPDLIMGAQRQARFEVL